MGEAQSLCKQILAFEMFFNVKCRSKFFSYPRRREKLYRIGGSRIGRFQAAFSCHVYQVDQPSSISFSYYLQRRNLDI